MRRPRPGPVVACFALHSVPSTLWPHSSAVYAQISSDVPSSSTSGASYPACTSGYIPFMGDGYCDELNNNEECGYDGGDCCSCTCVDTANNSCDDNDFDCIDPSASDDCAGTPSPAAAYGFPDCEGQIYDIQDGYCHDDLNNAECGWDGGDCCRCTCRDSWSGTCGSLGFDCQDPDAPTDCDTDAPTPSPAAAYGLPDCQGTLFYYQNGDCTDELNNEECGYDGGDCCRCTCGEDGADTYYPCGSGGYDCKDPSAPTDCPTPSPTAAATPSPVPYPDCVGNANEIGDGRCDSELDVPNCGYDGGDCCACTCESNLFTCGLYTFTCQDPFADCETTDSSTLYSVNGADEDTSSESAVSSLLSSSFRIVLYSVVFLMLCCCGWRCFQYCCCSSSGARYHESTVGVVPTQLSQPYEGTTFGPQGPEQAATLPPYSRPQGRLLTYHDPWGRRAPPGAPSRWKLWSAGVRSRSAAPEAPRPAASAPVAQPVAPPIPTQVPVRTTTFGAGVEGQEPVHSDVVFAVARYDSEAAEEAWRQRAAVEYSMRVQASVKESKEVTTIAEAIVAQELRRSEVVAPSAPPVEEGGGAEEAKASGPPPVRRAADASIAHEANDAGNDVRNGAGKGRGQGTSGGPGGRELGTCKEESGQDSDDESEWSVDDGHDGMGAEAERGQAEGGIHGEPGRPDSADQSGTADAVRVRGGTSGGEGTREDEASRQSRDEAGLVKTPDEPEADDADTGDACPLEPTDEAGPVKAADKVRDETYVVEREMGDAPVGTTRKDDGAEDAAEDGKFERAPSTDASGAVFSPRTRAAEAPEARGHDGGSSSGGNGGGGVAEGPGREVSTAAEGVVEEDETVDVGGAIEASVQGGDAADTLAQREMPQGSNTSDAPGADQTVTPREERNEPGSAIPHTERQEPSASDADAAATDGDAGERIDVESVSGRRRGEGDHSDAEAE